MSRRVIFIIAILFATFLIFGSYFYYRSSNNYILPSPFPTSSAESNLPAPADLTTNFDTTSSPPIFKILSIDQVNNIFSLQFVFPKTRVTETISSLVTCKNIDLSEVIKKFEDNNTINNPTIFSGLCSDDSCNEINKLCKLISYD